MKVNSVQFDSGVSFNAHIVNTTAVSEAKAYFARHGEVAKEKLFSKIEQAIEKHPSNTFIFAETRPLYGQKHTIVGSFYNSSYKEYNDKTVSNSNVKAFTTALKNFLMPRNKEKFSAVVGEQYSKQYQTWWAKNILPIWKDVKALF